MMLESFFMRHHRQDGSRASCEHDSADDAPPVGSAVFVKFHRHGTVVADNVILVGTECFRFRVPAVAREYEIGFIEPFAINIKLAMLKADRFTRHADNAFGQQHMDAGITDGHNVTAFGLAAQIGEAVEKLVAAIMKSWKHAWSVDLDWPEDKSENEPCNDAKEDDCDQANQCACWASPDHDGLDEVPHSHALCFGGHIVRMVRFAI